MFDGYFEYDNTEIINVARTEAYAADLGFFKPIFKSADLATMLDQTYTDPATDFASWYDPDLEESTEFYGVYPLDVSGLDNSSRQSAVFQSTADGGTPGRIKHATKSVVFNVALIASTERGAQYGMAWLRRILLGGWCSDDLTTDQSQGLDLRFLSSEPVYVPGESPWVSISPYWRIHKKVAFNAGPTITTRRTMSCGGAVWTCTFTGTIGVPALFGDGRILLLGYMNPATTDPWYPAAPYPGTADTSAHDFTDEECEVKVWQPIYDPLCPALVAPPSPPSVPLACYEPPNTWKRRKVVIPQENFYEFTSMVPNLNLYANDEVRNVRIRWYRDPDDDFDPDATPCDYDAEVVVSYIPDGGTFYLDSTVQTCYVLTSMGHRLRADSLAFSSDGTPIVWPELRCGQQYVMTIDYDAASTRPWVDLTFVPRQV